LDIRRLFLLEETVISEEKRPPFLPGEASSL